MEEEIKKVITLIRKDELITAFNVTESILNKVIQKNQSNKSLISIHNHIILLEARFRNLQRKENLGILSDSEIIRVQNQIRSAFLDFINDLKDLVKDVYNKQDLKNNQLVLINK